MNTLQIKPLSKTRKQKPAQIWLAWWTEAAGWKERGYNRIPFGRWRRNRHLEYHLENLATGEILVSTLHLHRQVGLTIRIEKDAWPGRRAMLRKLIDEGMIKFGGAQ